MQDFQTLSQRREADSIPNHSKYQQDTTTLLKASQFVLDLQV
jgi:hypothetical protein